MDEEHDEKTCCGEGFERGAVIYIVSIGKSILSMSIEPIYFCISISSIDLP
jgi:hypothetical protein